MDTCWLGNHGNLINGWKVSCTLTLKCPLYEWEKVKKIVLFGNWHNCLQIHCLIWMDKLNCCYVYWLSALEECYDLQIKTRCYNRNNIRFDIAWFTQQLTRGSHMKSGLVSHKVVCVSLLMILEALRKIASSLLNNWPHGVVAIILNPYFQTHFTNWYLEHFLWNCHQVNTTRLHCSLVNSGSGNGLGPSGNKPLPKSMLAMSYDITRQLGVTNSCQQANFPSVGCIMISQVVYQRDIWTMCLLLYHRFIVSKMLTMMHGAPDHRCLCFHASYDILLEIHNVFIYVSYHNLCIEILILS